MPEVVGAKINPIGSTEEVRAAGLDPAIYPSCAKPDKDRGIMGCECHPDCFFDDARLGGFKNTRPHYVGYTLRTDKAEGSHSKEDSMRCFDFVRVIQGRMITGQELRLRRRDGELIEVIAQEGETIYQRVEVGLNSRGQIIKPMQKYVPYLKEAKNPATGQPFDINLQDLTDPVAYVTVNVEEKVPKFPEIRQRADMDYDSKIQERQRQREAARGRAETEAWKSIREEMRAEPVGEVRPALDTGAATEAAEPEGDASPPDLNAILAGDDGPVGRKRKAREEAA